MDSAGPHSDRWSFGPFELDAQRVVLWNGGEVVTIQKLPARVLAHLVRAGGEVVSRAELMEAFWGGRRVGVDDRLNTCISEIRRALGDSAVDPKYIETVRGRGYRFRCTDPFGAARDVRVSDPPIRRRERWWPLVAAASLVTLFTLPHLSRVDRTEGPLGHAWAETADVGARARYLRAFSLIRTGRIADLRVASDLLARSTAMDSSFAAAHSARAIVSAVLAVEASEPEHLTTAGLSLAAASRLRPTAGHVHLARRAVASARGPDAAGRPVNGSASVARADPASRLTRGLELRRAGPRQASLRELTEWVSQTPEDARAWGELASTLSRLGRLADADAAYEVAIQLAPDRPELYLRRARVLLRIGVAPQRAVETIAAARSHTGMPADYLVHMDPLLARDLAPHLDWRGTDGSRFERSYDRGVFYVSRGLIETEVGVSHRAAEAFRRAVSELEPLTRGESAWSGTPDYFAFLGIAYAGLGRRAEARDIAAEILRRFPAASEHAVSSYMRTLAAEIDALLA